jgi:hypothetical protein
MIGPCGSSRQCGERDAYQKHPASALAPESALGLLPSIALSSAQAGQEYNPKTRVPRAEKTAQTLGKVGQFISLVNGSTIFAC